MFKKIREYIYVWFHRREIAENLHLTLLLAHRDILLEHQHEYILHLREEMKKLFKVPPMKAQPKVSTQNITQIGREIVEIRVNEIWSMAVPHDFQIMAADIRMEWARVAARGAVESLEKKLTQEIYKQIA